MAWNNQGGPWGGGKSPWGRNNGGGNNSGGGGGGGNRPPDFEEMLKRGQDRMKTILPGGFGSGRALGLIVLAALLLWLATGFYVVNPGQVGVNIRFGAYHSQTEPGFHWNFPAPFGAVETPDVATRYRTEVGFQTAGATDRDIPEESLMLTGDENIIDVRTIVLWRIEDVQKYLFEVDLPEASVKNAAEAAIREIIGQSRFQDATTERRGQIEAEAQALAQKILDSYSSGIRIEELSMQKVDAPAEVRDAFLDVQRARADRVSSVNEATGYYNKVLQDAQGQAVQIVKQAEAYKGEKVAIAEGDANRFLAVYAQYRSNPDITKRRLYLETMSDVFAHMNKVLIEPDAGSNGAVPYLPLDRLIQRRATDAKTPANGNSTSGTSTGTTGASQ